jgi:hypothetical protein
MSLELTPLLALLRRPGIFLLDDFGECPPDSPARRQAMLQMPDEALVFLLRHPALLGGLLQRDLAAFGRRLTVVPLKGVAAGEKVSTAIAEKDLQWVCLCSPTMTLKLFKIFEVRARTEATLDFLDRITRQVVQRSLEEQLIHRVEFAGYLEKPCRFLLLLPHRAIDAVLRLLINTPLDPTRLPMRRFHRPTLLETRSRRGLVVKSVRTRGCEPLRSASRHLGFIINSLFWDPGHSVVGGPSHGPFCFQDPRSRTPGSFLGRHVVGIDPHQAPIALGLFCLKAAFSEGRGACVSCRRI